MKIDNKFILASIAMFVLFSISVSAETSIYSGYAFSGDSISVNDGVMSFILNTNNNQIWVKLEGEDLYVAKTKCGFIQSYKVCFDSSSLDTTEGEYKAYVRILERVSDLAVTRSISARTLNIDDEVTFTIVIANSGDVTATDVYYEESIPSNFIVSQKGSLTSQGNVLYWRGDIKPDDNVELEFVLKADDFMNVSTSGKIEYNNSKTILTEFTDSTRFIVNPFFTIVNTVDPIELFPGKEFNFTINLSNNLIASDSSNIVDIKNFTITFPKSIEIIKSDLSLTKHNEKEYHYTGELYYNKSKAFEIEARPTKVGSYEIYSYIEYEKDKKISTDEIIKPIVVEKKEIEIRFDPVDNSNIDEQKSETLKIYIKNENPASKIVNLDIEVDTNLTFIFPTTVDQINKSFLKKVYDIKFFTPSVEKDTSFPVIVRVKYWTEFGEELYEEKKINIKVIKRKDIEIQHKFSSTNPEGGDDLKVEVIGKSQRQEKIENVYFSDTIDEMFTINGINQRELSIASNSEVPVYTYTIKMPYVNETVAFDINTSYSYIEDKQTFFKSKTSKISLKPKDYNIRFEKIITANPIYTGQVVNVKYVIENKDDFAITDLNIFTPSDYGYDLTAISYFIDRLNVGELVELNEIQNIRFKFNESTKLTKSKLEFIGEGGLKYTELSNEMSITPLYSLVEDPILFLNKSFNEDTNITTIVIKNIGNTNVQIELNDNDKEYNMNVDALSIVNVTYPETVFEKINSIASAKYNFRNSQYTSYSNSPGIINTATTSTTTTTTTTSTTSTSTTTTTTIKKETSGSGESNVKIAKLVEFESNVPKENKFLKKIAEKLRKFFKLD